MTKCVKALSGTGLARPVVVLPVLEPPPEAPVAELPVLVRVGPLADVFALEEIVLLVLAELSAVALEVEESAEDPLTAELPKLVLTLLEESAELAEAGALTPEVAEAVSSALPAEAVPPAPAPDEEPAVFDPPAELEVPLVSDDCT